VAQSLDGTAAVIKVIRFPWLHEHGDVSDWLDSGGTAEQLRQLAERTPEWSPQQHATTDRQDTPRGLDTTCLATIRPMPVKWLIPNYFPLGKLVLIAGDGGHGKSSITLDTAARLTTGRPCLGLQYNAMSPSDVLIISCEDDYEDTVVPRL